MSPTDLSIDEPVMNVVGWGRGRERRGGGEEQRGYVPTCAHTTPRTTDVCCKV